MASNETGWTAIAPTANGMYWWRADERDCEPEMHEIADGKVYRMESRRSEPVANYGGEWLGPISPSDAEQLMALRKAVEIALPIIEHMPNHTVTSGIRRGEKWLICYAGF